MKKKILLLLLASNALFASAILDTQTSLCYNNPTTEGYSIFGIGIFYGVTTPIKNITNQNLTNVEIIKTFDGINMSLLSDISIDSDSKTLIKDSDEAEKNSDIFASFGIFNGSLFNKGIVYRMDNFVQNEIHSIYDYSMFSFDMSKIKIGAEYTRGGQRYYAILHNCDESNVNEYITGAFDSWDTFRDNISKPPNDRNISTKIVNKSFQLSLASINDNNNAYESKVGIGDIDVSIYPKGSSDSISNHVIFNITAHNHTNKTFTVTSASRDAVVGFKFCATYEKYITDDKIKYHLYNSNACSSLTKINSCDSKTTGVPTWHMCRSTDDFAIRPYAFVLFGNNEYKKAGENFNLVLKAVDEKNFSKVGNSSYSGKSVKEVNSTEAYDANINNLNINSHFYQPTKAEIKQMQTDIGPDNNTSVKGHVSDCPNLGILAIKNSNYFFNNGKINAILNFDETGVLNISINEKHGSEWAYVDEDDTNDSQRYIKPSIITYDEDDINTSELQLFIPYEFDITASYNTTNANKWLYMSKINSTSSAPNISAFLKYTVTALNKNKTILKNYTRECFPDTDDEHSPRVDGLKLNTTFNLSLDMDLNSTKATSIDLYDEDNNSNVILTPNKNKALLVGENHIHELMSPFQFKEGKGEESIYFNIDRNSSVPQNPTIIKILDANASVSPMASLDSPEKINGIKINKSKIFLYERAHATRQRYFGSDGNVSIFYETYCDKESGCDKSLLPDGLNSKYSDDPRWFINTKHNIKQDGKVSNISEKSYGGNLKNVKTTVLVNSNAPEKANLSYNGSKGYPYKTTMQLNGSSWLVYNKYSNNKKNNEFEVEFGKNGMWSGPSETNSTTTSSAADITNRRLMW